MEYIHKGCGGHIVRCEVSEERYDNLDSDGYPFDNDEGYFAGHVDIFYECIKCNKTFHGDIIINDITKCDEIERKN